MESYLGFIYMTGLNFAPRNYANCDGQLLAIAQNTALFSLLGTTYGGDGRTTFALPDLRGRFPMHTGQGPGLPNRNMGPGGGHHQKTLSASNLPSHNHSFRLGGAATGTALKDNYVAGTTAIPLASSSASSGNDTLNSATITHTGANTAFNIMNPYCVLRFVICTAGLYPPRN